MFMDNPENIANQIGVETPNSTPTTSTTTESLQGKKVGSVQTNSVFKVFGKVKKIDYNQELVDQQINMNPTEKRIYEPLTGSSVVVDTVKEERVPENGFPAGYGPNAELKRIEKPKKPKLSERVKRLFGQLTKVQRRLLIIIPSTVMGLIVIFSIIANVTGMFSTDYSKTYRVAKTIKSELQKLRSNVNCDKVTEYNENTFTSMEIYQGYIEVKKDDFKGSKRRAYELSHDGSSLTYIMEYKDDAINKFSFHITANYEVLGLASKEEAQAKYYLKEQDAVKGADYNFEFRDDGIVIDAAFDLVNGSCEEFRKRDNNFIFKSADEFYMSYIVPNLISQGFREKEVEGYEWVIDEDSRKAEITNNNTFSLKGKEKITGLEIVFVSY